MPNPDDAEVKAAIRFSDSRTVSGIVEELQARFGPERAWSPEMVRCELATHLRRRYREPEYGNVPGLQAFIADLAYLHPLDEIVRLGRVRFAPQPFPSRSQVHRIIQRQLAEDRARRPGTAKRTQPRPKR